MIDNYTYSVNTSYDNGQFTIVEKIGDGASQLDLTGYVTKAEFETEVNSNNRIITLSTCYNKKEKLVIHGKLIKEEKRYSIDFFLIMRVNE